MSNDDIEFKYISLFFTLTCKSNMFCDDNSYLPVIVNLLKVMKFKVMFYNHHYRKLSGDYSLFCWRLL